MTVIIDGTTGISTPGEAVSGNLSYTGTLTGGTGVVNLGSGQVYKDASGNVGLGITPSAWGSNNRTIDIYGIGSFSSFSNGSGGYELDVSLNAYNSASGWRYKVSSYAVALYQQAAGSHIWYNAAAGTAGNAISFTQAMTLDSSGNLLVNQTSQTGAEKVGISFDRTGSWGLAIKNTSSTAPNNATYVQFYYASTNTGGINSTGTTTSYATTSDYRLKEDIAPMTGALAKIAALKPCTYSWKSTGEADEGFIAHELQEVCPSAVTGEKDAMDAEGNPQYQGIDTSFLVATLTAAIQEQQTLITALTARITALEAPIV